MMHHPLLRTRVIPATRPKYPIPAILRHNVQPPSIGYFTRDTLAFSPSLTPVRECRTHPACQRISPWLHWFPVHRESRMKLWVHMNTGGWIAACRSQVASCRSRGPCPQGWRMSDALSSRISRRRIQGLPQWCECEPVM